jgi:AMP-polyphosphate phosphotransferase
MLEAIDLSRTVEKSDYKREKDALGMKLGALQRQLLEHNIPVIVVFEGWDAAGKGTLINRLIMPLDPRGFSVHSTLEPNDEERLRPFLWRFWTKTPASGRIAIFDRSWYRRLLNDRVDGDLKPSATPAAERDIISFERQLANDGNVIIKFFLHISKKEQKKRFEKLRRNPSTAWRVTDEDLKRQRQYNDYRDAAEAMLAATDSDFAPWTIVEAEDHRFATLKIFKAMIRALEQKLSLVTQKPASVEKLKDGGTGDLNVSILANVDLMQELEREDYRERLKKKQRRLRELEHEIYVRRTPVIIVYEGCDAAGKGGNIRRLTEQLDPRGYEVVPIAAPNDVEKRHHYLWRFWNEMPKAGHISIFDRSWYGRVLVERVEGFCPPSAWRRAYREINEMEQHITAFGAVMCKFWLQIDQDEQLRRFKERERLPHKQWKITDEDWRNRKQWDAYYAAVEEMLARTSTPYAPWTVVESNCKWFARVKVLDCVTDAIEAVL